MTKFLAWIHGWVGAVFGLLFGFVMLTGAILLVESMIEQQEVVNALPAATIEKSPEQVAKDLDVAFAVAQLELGFTPTSVRPPLENIPGYRVQLDRNNRYYLSSDDLTPIEASHGGILTNPNVASVLSLLRGWHVSIVNGTSLTGWIGLIGSFLGILGLIIFWPWRRTFNWRNWGWPKDMGRAALMSNHLTAGTISLVFLLLFGLSGFYLDFRGSVNSWIAAHSGQEISEEAEAADLEDSELVLLERPVQNLAALEPAALGAPQVSTLMAAGEAVTEPMQARAGRQQEATAEGAAVAAPAMGGGAMAAAAPVEVAVEAAPVQRRRGGGGLTPAQLAALGDPKPLSELAMLAYQAAPGHLISDVTGMGTLNVTFRMRPDHGAVDPLGRTYVTMNGFTGELGTVEIGAERHWMLKTVQLSGPLHMGTEMSQVYKAVATLGSVLVYIICFTGFVSFVRKQLASSVAKRAG